MTTPFVSSNVTDIQSANVNTIDSLLSNLRWTNPTISYSFPTSNSPLLWSTLPSSGYGPQFGDGEPWNKAAQPLTAKDQINVELALQKWTNVANINFIKLSETTDEVGDIRVAYSEDQDELVLAWSYLPGVSVRAGDIWINTLGILNFQDWDPGTISFQSILHEIGHAIGLKHPFLDADDKPSVATLPADLDNKLHTIMSYTYANLQGDEGNEFSFHPTTPTVIDIPALQYIYGATNNDQSNNDIYSYNDGNIYHETIWDAGGTDAIQYTGMTPTSIDLNAKNGSYIGQPVYVQSNGVTLGLPIPNIWIAGGVTIENATAGQGNDILIGNDNSNTLDGGSGIDTVLSRTSHNQFTLNKITNGYTVTDNANTNNRDILIAVERLKFDDIGIALDLDGHAGEVAKLLGAVFGASAITNQEYVGIGLTEADKGLNYEQLGELAINAKGLKTSDEIVTLLWNNLFGSLPSKSEKAPYIKMLDSGQISMGALAVAAADSDYNADNIDLVGLIQTGLAFI